MSFVVGLIKKTFYYYDKLKIFLEHFPAVFIFSDSLSGYRLSKQVWPTLLDNLYKNRALDLIISLYMPMFMITFQSIRYQ